MNNKAVALILLAIVIIAAGSLWLSKSKEAMADVRNVVAAELSNALGTEVLVGDVEIASYHSVILHNPVIYDKQGQPAVSGETVRVTFSLFSLLRGGANAAMIREIAVDNPHFILRQAADGKWNVENLFSQTRTADSQFTGKVTIAGGSADIAAEGGQWTLEDIHGTLDFAQKPKTGIKLAAGFQGSPLSIEGAISTQGEGGLTFRAASLPLKEFAGLAGQSAVTPVEGVAQSVVVNFERKSGDIRFAGEANLENAGIDIDGLPVRAINGLVTFTNEKIYLFNNVEIYGQPLKLRGWVAINAGEPVVDLRVSSTRFDPSVIAGNLPVRGSVAFNAIVTGTPSAPVIDGEYNLARGELAGYQVENSSAKLRFADNILTIKEYKGVMLGGTISASGTINLSAGNYQLHIKGSGIDSGILAEHIPDFSGPVNADIVASGDGRDLAQATVYGTVSVPEGSYRGIPFHKLETSFYYAGGRLTLDYLNAGLEQGMITAGGTVDSARIDVNMSANHVPLGLIAGQFDIPLEGTADFAGTLTGTPSFPVLAVNFKAADGQAFYQPFTEAGGTVTVNPGQVILDGITLSDGTASHKLAGTMGLTGQRELNLTITSTKARAENLVKLIAPGEKLTGNVDNEITITGPLDHFNAEGRITLTDGSFRGYLVARGEGTYRRQNGVTTINDFVINSLNTQVKLSGAITADKELDLHVAADNLDVGSLHLNLPEPITGKAKFEGKLTGTPDSPVFSGTLTADTLAFKGREMKNVAGNINIAGDEIKVPGFSFNEAGGTFRVNGTLNVVTGAVHGGIDVEKGDLALLFHLMDVPVQKVSGRMDGHIMVGGTAGHPDIWITGSVSEGKIKNVPLEKIDVDIAMENGVVTINQFSARQGQGVLAVRGTADLNGKLDIEAGGRDIDAGLVTALTDSDVPVTGKLNFGAQITGTYAKPHAAVSLDIAGGGVANAAFDSLYGLFIIDSNSIHVNQVFLTKGQYRASAYGLIPLAALTAEGRQRASQVDQMDLKVRLDEADLSILPLLTNEVSWAAGRTQGELTIGGTLAQPWISGSISVKDGVIKLAKFADPIQKVGIDIQFEGDKIVLKTFDGHMGQGYYAMTGSAGLEGLSLGEYSVFLTLDKLGVNNKYFKGPLTGNLTLEKVNGKPKLSGKILFENDMINIPLLDFAPSDTDIAVDLELVAGNKVRFYNPYMYDIWAEGKVKLAGSTVKPDASGRITATRGTVNYLQTQFKVKDGSVDFIQFASFEPVIRLSAETRLQNTVVRLNISGPVSGMEFNLTSDPAMSQQELLSLLTLRSRYFDKQSGADKGFGRDEVLSLLDAGLQMRFVSEVEGAFRDAFGLDDFRVVRDTLWSTDESGKNSKNSDLPAGREVYNIEMSKYVTDRLMLSYTMGIDHNQHSAAFRYDFNRRISLTGSLDDENKGRLGLETRFRF